jgi:uncharacterized membrane protein
MSELIIVDYHDAQRAGQVLRALRYLHTEWNADLERAVVLTKQADGKVQLQQREADPLDSIWGERLADGWPGALLDVLFLPTGGLAQSALRDEALRAPNKVPNVNWLKQQMGITDDFVGQVGKLIRPGDSAFLLLVTEANPDQMVDAIREYGGRLLQTSFTPQQDRLFQDLLDTSSPV